MPHNTMLYLSLGGSGIELCIVRPLPSPALSDLGSSERLKATSLQFDTTIMLYAYLTLPCKHGALGPQDVGLICFLTYPSRRIKWDCPLATVNPLAATTDGYIELFKNKTSKSAIMTIGNVYFEKSILNLTKPSVICWSNFLSRRRKETFLKNNTMQKTKCLQWYSECLDLVCRPKDQGGLELRLWNHELTYNGKPCLKAAEKMDHLCF